MVTSNTRQDYALDKFDLWALSLSGPAIMLSWYWTSWLWSVLNSFFFATIERAETKANIWWSLDRILWPECQWISRRRIQKSVSETRGCAFTVSHWASRLPTRNKMSINSINPILIELWCRCDREKDLVTVGRHSAPFRYFEKCIACICCAGAD